MPDTRFQPFVEYHRRFLLWLALLVFALRLGSRRQIDFDLRDLELCLLDNLNRLAATEQTRLPVTNTVDHFLEHTGGIEPFARLRQRCAQRLIREISQLSLALVKTHTPQQRRRAGRY